MDGFSSQLRTIVWTLYYVLRDQINLPGNVAEWLWRRFQERPVSGLVVNLPVGKTARVRIPPLSKVYFLFILLSYERGVESRNCFLN